MLSDVWGLYDIVVSTPHQWGINLMCLTGLIVLKGDQKTLLIIVDDGRSAVESLVDINSMTFLTKQWRNFIRRYIRTLGRDISEARAAYKASAKKN